MAAGLRIGVFWLVLWLMVRAFSCKPIAADATSGAPALLAQTDKPAATAGQRTSRLQKPSTQVLNTGFDEIVVESNLQVHRGTSKSKSKITLPNTSSTSSTAAVASSARNGGGGGNDNKSSRSLEV